MIAVFYHCLFFKGEPPELLPQAIEVVVEQMMELKRSGLEDAAQEIHVGINGGEESKELAQLVLPPKAKLIYHGLQCRNECRTIVEIEKWLPGHENWMVLYFHTKGITHVPNTGYAQMDARWRRCMMKNCVTRWPECVASLKSGYEAVGVHWLTGMCNGSQHYFAGTFFWATGKYLRTLPSIFERERIKVSGIDNIDSRYEAEVWLGNGPRIPRIRDMDRSHGIMQCP